MRPYLAIIKDSFRSALASRVLYVLLGLILLLLLALAPLHIRESLDTKIDFERDVRTSNIPLVAGQITEGLAKADKGMLRIWDSLSAEVKNKINKIARDGADRQPGQGTVSNLNEVFAATDIQVQLNKMIADPKFFRKQDWTGNYNSETVNYLKRGAETLTRKQQQRLNRLLISQSFGGMINTGSRSSLDFYYGPFDSSNFMPGFVTTNMSHSQFASQLSIGVSWFLDKVVLSIGLLIAILVTANLVPQTFEPGTLNLLLSKPVSRAGLFLAKFIGGCMFIALCAALLFVGLWLWMGFGLGIWDRAVLLSIPLYVIVFAIYYSVSSFTGLVTRSTILAIIATGLFWAACWSVGSLYAIFNGQAEASEIKRIASTGKGVVISGRGSEPKVWDNLNRAWVEVSAAEIGQEEMMQRAMFNMMGVEETPFPDPLGPVYFEEKDLVAFGRVLVGDPATHRKQQFFVSRAPGNFVRQGVFPSGSIGLFASKENLICVNGRGRFYRFDPLIKFKTKSTDRETWFVSAGPDQRVNIEDRRQVAVHHQSGSIAVYNQGTITIYAVDESDEKRNYKLIKSTKIETGTRESMTCHLLWQGSNIVLAFGNGQVMLLDGESLEKKYKDLPETRVAIDSISASPDGRWFSLLYKDETLRMLDAENPSIEKPSVRGQGSISAVSLGVSKMYVADRTDRVTEYDIDSLATGNTWSAKPTKMQHFWRYGIKPLYFAFPKPGEFYKVVAHLSSTNDSQHNPNVDLTTQSVRSSPWSPLVSGLVFMAVMLSLSCFVFSRADY